MADDRVKHPKHYTQQSMETWDGISMMYGLPGLASSVVRYVTRYRDKDNPVEDLSKAREYIIKIIKESGGQERLQQASMPVVIKGLCGAEGLKAVAIHQMAKPHDVGCMAEALRCVELLLEMESEQSSVITPDPSSVDVSTSDPMWPYAVSTSVGDRGDG